MIHGDGIDVVADGEFVVIVGARAAASRRCCAWWRAWKRSRGRKIAIGERVVNDLEPKDRDIAMVFQNYALYPHMSVYDNMAYGLKSAASPRDDIEASGARRRRSWSWRDCSQRKPREALRRPAPARGHGPRHRARAAGVPVRRAAVQPRRQAARADAPSKSEAAPAPRAPPACTSPTTRSRR